MSLFLLSGVYAFVGTVVFVLEQFLEEKYPMTPLLPADPKLKAVNIQVSLLKVIRFQNFTGSIVFTIYYADC